MSSSTKIYFLVVLLLPSLLYAQSKKRAPYNFSIYWDAGQVVAIPATLELGIEKRITEKIVIDLEGGLLYPYIEEFRDSRSGYKVSSTLKFFMSERVSIGPRLLYRSLTIDKEEWFFRHDFSYSEELSYQRHRNLYGVMTDVGIHKIYDDSNFALEFNLGVGYGFMDVSTSGLPADVTDGDDEFRLEIFSSDGAVLIPLMRYGLKLKYIIK